MHMVWLAACNHPNTLEVLKPCDGWISTLTEDIYSFYGFVLSHSHALHFRVIPLVGLYLFILKTAQAITLESKAMFKINKDLKDSKCRLNLSKLYRACFLQNYINLHHNYFIKLWICVRVHVLFVCLDDIHPTCRVIKPGRIFTEQLNIINE